MQSAIYNTEMLPEPFQDALILTGPTGSGKTQLGIKLAQRLDAEIISMDSMALYRGMDIGTAKPTLEERARVPHHLIDVLDPWQAASVAWWLEQAAACCRDIRSRGKRVLFVGGTPLYVKALLRGLFDGPAGDSAIRDRLTQEAATLGSPALHERLAQADPVTAARVHANDLRRIIRALEVLEITGKPISAWQQQWQVRSQESGVRGQELNANAFWLDVPRAELYARINRRVEEMFAAGLVEEVRALRSLPRGFSREAGQALGYKEIFAYLDGQVPLEETILQVQMRSRNFAKRQISWFRHLSELCPLTGELTGTLPGFTIQG
jgi:tRNA dimethylallyltransferase